MDPEEGSTKTDEVAPASTERDHVDELAAKRADRFTGPNKRLANLDYKAALKSKKTLIGGGVAGFVVAIIFAAIALLPLKIEALMKNIFQRRIGDKIEHMEEKRADKMVVTFLIKNAGGSTDAGVVRDTSLLGGVLKTWRLNKFGDKFTAKSGISIKPAADGKGITLTTGEKGVSKDFKNAAEFEKFLNGGTEGTLKGLDARKFIRSVTRSETYWFQIYKRSNMRKFMRSAYGIHKWSWFSGKEGEEAGKSIRDASIDSSSERLEKDIPEVVECASEGSQCANDKGPRENPNGAHAPNIEPVPSSSGSGEDLKSNLKNSLSNARDAAKKLSPKAVAEKTLTKLLSEFIDKDLAGKISSKSIPILGAVLLIDQISRVDHFFYSGQADTTLRTIHKLQYATLYAQWASIADNFKDPNHKMSGDEVNAVMTKLEGMEKSAAFNDIFLQTANGNKIKPSLGVSDKPHVQPIADNYNTYASTLGAPLTAPLRLWYKFSSTTHIASLINAFNALLGDVFAFLIKIVPGADKIFQFIGQYLSGLILQLVEPAVSGTEIGSPLVNGIDAGGAVTGQDFAGSLGAHTMTTAQTQEQAQAIAFDKAQSAPGLYDRLFSTDYAASFVNQLAVMTPSTPGAAVGQVSSYSLAIIQNPFHIFNLLLGVITGKAHAGAPIDLYGLQDKSFTEAELDQPITDISDRNGDGKIDAQDCQTNEDGTAFTDAQKKDFNNTSHGQICLLDVATAQDVTSAFTSADDGGLGGSAAASTTPVAGVGTGTEQELAKKILANTNITFDLGPTGRIAQPVIDLAAGNKASTGDAAPATDVSITLLGAILTAAQTHKINISSLTTGHSVGDVHSVGRAVDFNYVDGVHSTGRDTNDVTIINILAGILPSGSGFGQTKDPNTGVPCGPQITLPAGMIQFPDTCNHIHIQVPVGTP